MFIRQDLKLSRFTLANHAALLCGLSALSASAWTMPALAQAATASDPANANSGEIVVTARKRNENIVDTPLSITALGGDSLAQRGVPSLHQVDQIVPSLTITNFGAGNLSDVSIFIRGIGTADHLILTDPGVGIYVDGVYLGRSMGANFSLPNIDHMEILRGPQGTLSGRNTLGGAVNIVTKQPSQDEHYEIEGTLGSRERANASFYGDTPITDTLAISLAGSYEHRGGVGRFVNLPNEGTKVGQIDKGSGRFAAKWTPSPNVSFLLAIDGSKGNYGLSPMEDIIINPNGSSGVTQASQPANRYDLGTENPSLPNTSSKDLGVSLTSTIQLSKSLILKLIGSERYSDYTGGLDDDNSALSYSEFPEIGHARQYTGETQLNGEFGRLNFVGGLYYFRESGGAEQPQYVFAGSLGSGSISQTTNSYAGYLHAGYAITDKLKLSGGARYTEDHKRASAFLACCLNPSVTRSNSWHAPTWDAALDYKFRPTVAAYATIQRGYESGGYPPRPFGGAATFVPYNPTYATNYEGGLKGRLGNALRFSASIFYTQYKDLVLQYNQLTSAGFLTIEDNAGRSRTYGAEFEGTLKTGLPFSLNGSVGYNNAKVTKVNAGTVGVAAGDVPQLTPKWTVALGPQFSSTLASGNVITARIDTSYRSSMFGQSANNAYNYIKPRYLTNFEISYSMAAKQITFSIYGTNIFNEVYDNSRIDQYSAGFTEVILNNDRSEFGVKLKKTF